MANLEDKKDIIVGEEFQTALDTAARINSDIKRNKESDKRLKCEFIASMFEHSKSIMDIASKKKKQRTDADNKYLADYKQMVSRMYKQYQGILFDEKYEQKYGIGEKKVAKMVDAIAPAIIIACGLGHDTIIKEFERYGICLSVTGTPETQEIFDNDNTCDIISHIMNLTVINKETQTDNENHITTDIYQTEVPSQLIFDKDSNPEGIKPADFKKLVDLETKRQDALADASKVSEKATNEAEDKQFAIARNELMLEFLDNMLTKMTVKRNKG